MEDNQIEELRRWAVGLGSDGRPEVKAAAKAILLLADDLRAARSQLLEERMIRQALESQQADAEEVDGEDVERDLRSRLRMLLPRRLAPH